LTVDSSNLPLPTISIAPFETHFHNEVGRKRVALETFGEPVVCSRRFDAFEGFLPRGDAVNVE
jgi:hypothetical protein